MPTFVAFLQDLEAPYEVKDYVRIYLGMHFIINTYIYIHIVVVIKIIKLRFLHNVSNVFPNVS